MKKLIVLLTLIMVSMGSFAQAQLQMCNAGSTTFGGPGGDAFPWSVAKPFPWNTIQGIWINKDQHNRNLIFVFKVTRSTEKIKQLYAEVYDARECGSLNKQYKLKGVGILSSSEKNVVRLNLNNILVKLALFKSEDLDINKYVCGTNTLGATLYRLDEEAIEEGGLVVKDSELTDMESASYMLKKISNSTEYKCKR